MINRSIWCPNVVLLDPRSSDKFPTDQVIKIINSIPSNITSLFVAIGNFNQFVIDSQIILQKPEYSIYKEDLKGRNTLTSLLLETGMQHVYYINAQPEFTRIAFIHFIDILGFDYPIFCLASELSTHLHPAAFVVPEPTHTNQLKNEPNFNFSNCYTTHELITKNISFINKKIIFV